MCGNIQDHQLSLGLNQLVTLLADDGAQITGAGLCVGCRKARAGRSEKGCHQTLKCGLICVMQLGRLVQKQGILGRAGSDDED